ncbi:DUF4157 domain-containing protein [Nocardia sp. CA2R105]|uniref:WXG100-like domain-containing protein n=1 Tax=Nocardia coffeae TaxID=2873381 RepID=UPI001CA6B949|nr:DUF4157 domain-containing protein [Nocardia coffeae]MBY8859882.1 DUF4157 domain-containing protein [Nocardia coffeae]
MPAPTVPNIVFRSQDYHDAGEEFAKIGVDASDTHNALLAVLNYYSGMAGVDDAGKQWATTYDQAAQAAIGTSATLAEACVQTRNLIAVGVYNHAVTEATANHSTATSPAKPTLTPDITLGTTVSPAAGGGIDVPFGWSVVQDLVSNAWPNGNRIQLHAAADAWHTAASDYRTLATAVTSAVGLLSNNQSPEIDTAVASCNQRKTDFTDLADICQKLGDSCNDYAQNLDDAQKKAVDELAEFVEEAVAFEAAFAILAPFTGTLSEWVGNAAYAGRIAQKAEKIKGFISALIARSGEIVSKTLTPLLERARPILQRVQKWVDEARTNLSIFARGGGYRDGKLFSRSASRLSKDIMESGDHLPITQETIEEYAAKAGVDLKGVNVHLGTSADDIRYYDAEKAVGSTTGNDITLAPSAFSDPETLMRTLVHEKVHVDQYASGTQIGTGTSAGLEAQAYAAEDAFWAKYIANGGK